jgi:hypothetical protein
MRSGRSAGQWREGGYSCFRWGISSLSDILTISASESAPSCASCASMHFDSLLTDAKLTGDLPVEQVRHYPGAITSYCSTIERLIDRPIPPRFVV